jgi:hypothetical protein
MNAVKRGGFCAYAIAGLMAVGITMTIAACSDSSTPAQEAVTAPPTLSITVDNGELVASTLVDAIGLSFDLADISDDYVDANPGGMLSSVQQAKKPAGLYTILLSEVQQEGENCAVAGTVMYSATQTDPLRLSVGDRLSAIYVDCDDGLGYTINGQVDMTIVAYEGSLWSDVFLLGMDMVMTDVVVSDSAGIATADGGLTLTLDQLDFPMVGLGMTATEFRLGHQEEVLTLTDCDHSMMVDTGTAPAPVDASVLGRLNSPTLGGSVDYETTVMVKALGDDNPYVGELLVTGFGNSTVRIVIVDSDSIRLEIDQNGDGTVDAYVDKTWTELGGGTLPALH